MILRRREQRTLDALDELVLFLRGVSEERKAVISVSNGWRLFTPNASLARPIDDTIPTGAPFTVDPRSGRLGTSAAFGQSGPRPCEAERVALAALDEPPHFQEILDTANRANVSFYPIDPRGLAVFDEDIAPAAGVGVGFDANPTIPVDQDLARLNARHGSLRTLADATDGIAVVDNSNLNAGLARVTSDFSAYYLLGYHTTGRLDGKFHKISVRVKRPGIQVRARRGYLALAEDPRTTPERTAPGQTPVSGTGAMPVTAALAALVPFTSDATLRVRTAVAPLPGGGVAVSVVADGGPTFAVRSDSAEGEADAQLLDKSGVTVARGHAPFAANAPGVRIVLVAAALPAGDYDLRVRTARAGNSVTSLESVRLTVPAEHAGIGTILYRRGVTTGNKEVATADVRFRRTERLRVDAPVHDGGIQVRFACSTGRESRSPSRFRAPLMLMPTDPDGRRLSFHWHRSHPETMWSSSAAAPITGNRSSPRFGWCRKNTESHQRRRLLMSAFATIMVVAENDAIVTAPRRADR